MKEIKDVVKLSIVFLIAGFSLTLGICGCVLLINATLKSVFF